MANNNLIGKDKNSMTVIIDGREILTENVRLLMTMDTCANSCTVTMPWQPGLDSDIDEITRPYSFSECKIYIGDEFQMAGILYNVTHRVDKNGIKKELEIYSKTADIIDSTVIPPYAANNISLTDRCKQQVNKFGIDVVVSDGVDLIRARTYYTKQLDVGQFFDPNYTPTWTPLYSGSKKKTIYEEQKFSRVVAKQTDKIFDHLKKLAAQRGVLLSCTKWGDLLVTIANTEGVPIGTIEESQPFVDGYEAHFKGRERFQVYRALASSSRKARSRYPAVVVDDTIIPPRVLTFRAGNNLPGEGKQAAIWKKNKSAADAMTIPFPTSSFYGPDEKLWQPNTNVTVISPTIGITDGFIFIISQIEFEYGASGANANLKLKPPTAYTTGEIEEPWINE